MSFASVSMETDAKDISYVRIDRTRKIPLTVLVRALGFGSDDTIFEIFGDSETLRNTVEKDLHKNASDSRTEEGLKDVYERSYHRNQILTHELIRLKESYVYGRYVHKRCLLHQFPSLAKRHG